MSLFSKSRFWSAVEIAGDAAIVLCIAFWGDRWFIALGMAVSIVWKYAFRFVCERLNERIEKLEQPK